MRRTSIKSKQTKQRVYREPLMTPENRSTLQKGVALLGLGLAGFFAALPAIDFASTEMDARLDGKHGHLTTLTNFHNELSPKCSAIIIETAAANMEPPARRKLIVNSGLCNLEALKAVEDIDYRRGSISFGVETLVNRDIADTNAVIDAQNSQLGVKLASGLVLVSLGAAAAFGLSRINEAAARSFEEAARRSKLTKIGIDPSDSPQVVSTETTSQPNQAVASDVSHVEPELLPLRVMTGSGGAPMCITEPCPGPRRELTDM